MQTITFECKVITPLFLTGADGQTPELRAPSIKGAMRFWWRALHGHLQLKDINTQERNIVKGLKSLESEIFGGSGTNVTRSKIGIHIIHKKELKTEKSPLVPHKAPSMLQQAISVGQLFEVQLSLSSNNPPINLEQLKSLFLLTCYLGGFGKRSRRGMGSIHVLSINGDNKQLPQTVDLKYICDLINQFSSFYVLTKNSIHFTYSGSSPLYGYIKKVELGNDSEDLLRKISNATHKTKQENLRVYDPSMGHAFRGRYASPVYVSVIQGSLRPIITTLNIAPDRDGDKASLIVQETFKKRIL